MDVPVLDIPFSDAERDFIRDGIDEILDSGFLTMGEKTETFETSFQEFAGTSHAVACDSGTSALELILRGLDIEEEEVIVPTNTFMATAHAAMNTNNRVMFVDSDPETLSIDPASLSEQISDDTAAVILVHIGGIISEDVDEIQAICENHGAALIEDCAHAHGSEIDGVQAGSLGVAGAFSFFPTKVLTTGEGGVAVTADQELAERMRMIRNHGKNPELQDRISEPGGNYRMSEFQALIGVQQLRSAEERIRERQQIAAYYDEHVPDIPGIEPLSLPDNVTSTYYKYVVYLDESIDRSELKSLMADHDVSLTGEVYENLCHDAPIWDDYTYCGKQRPDGSGPGDTPACSQWPDCNCDSLQESFPGARYISEHHACLPVYPGLSEAQLEHVIESLKHSMAELEGDSE